MAFDITAFNAQDELVDLLGTLSLSEWSIDFGLPAYPQDLQIWVDDTIDSPDRTGDTSGLKSQNETFNLFIYVWDAKTDATARELRDEIKPVANQILNAIAANSTLGGSVLYARGKVGGFESGFVEEQGRKRLAVMKITVECSAFLSA